MNEFAMIRRYFTRPARRARLGVGDDAAVLVPTPGTELLVSTDLLVAGRHFFADVDPAALGHKTLAVNLSDIAAMGGEPVWAVLGAALPTLDEAWIAAFCDGLFALAERTGVDIVGGDTTRGPLTLSVTIGGEVPAGQAIRRDGARPGDEIWVSGQLGLAAAALAHLSGEARLSAPLLAECRKRLEWPEPRIGLGMALRGIASAMLDISDGFAGDLGHILERSAVGATVDIDALPTDGRLERAIWRDAIAAGGDDYELCFTAPSAQAAAVRAAAARAGVDVTRVGVIDAAPGLRLLDAQQRPVHLKRNGFDHFA